MVLDPKQLLKTFNESQRKAIQTLEKIIDDRLMFEWRPGHTVILYSSAWKESLGTEELNPRVVLEIQRRYDEAGWVTEFQDTPDPRNERLICFKFSVRDRGSFDISDIK